MENENWIIIKENLRNEINNDDFDLWIKPINVISFSEKELILSVPDSFFRDKVIERFKKKIENCIKKQFKISPYIDIKIGNGNLLFSDENNDSKKRKNVINKSNTLPSQNQDLIDKKFSFGNFVVGQNNELAYAAAKRISASPGEQYNPFFYYGSTGLGKTHLLKAIQYECNEKHPHLNIIYVTSEHFLDEFVNSIQKNKVRAFRDKYRKADVLLIDDVHFYENKDQIQNELFNTFNLLIQSNKQMVFTSDRSQKELKGIEERLISRFSQGLTADIKPPGLETRQAIIIKKMNEYKVKISNDIIYFLAENITSNVRKLEGAVQKIGILHDLKGELTIEDIKVQLEDLLDIGSIKKILTPHEIIKEVADYYNISIGDLKSKTRKNNVVQPRQMAMYLMRGLTSFSVIQIGYEFGGRDHSTVCYSCDTIEKKIKEDMSTRNDYEQLYKRLSRAK